MNKAMIERIAQSLSHPYGRIKLQADGHELAAEVRPVTKTGMTYKAGRALALHLKKCCKNVQIVEPAVAP